MNRLRVITMMSCCVLFLCVSVQSASADTAYVSSITQITLRTEPGVAHRIIEMLKSGTELEVLAYQPDWSRVRTPRGNEGWILTRFITDEKPKILLVDELEQKKNALADELAAVKSENIRLSDENDRLIQIEEKYKRLKAESAQFFELKEKHDQIRKAFEQQSEQITALKAGLKNDKTTFMMAGIGVFILGLIFGLSTRKKKKSSLL